MKRKKYSSHKSSSGKKEPMVQEGSSGRYARQIPRKSSVRIGISLAEAKKRLRTPVKRSEKDIEWALGIVGIGEGPPDLSENMRAYLRREK
jgi:hypothetical protein